MNLNPPKHIVATSAVVINDHNEMLLVRTHWRSDTWEAPGGQVEEGEALDQSVIREVFEETGINIRPLGITGIYYNATNHVLSVVFRAEYLSGKIKIQEKEIKEAKFVEINEDNIDQYIIRPHFKSRTLDAMNAQNFIPYETWKVTPYDLIGRLDP